MLYLGLPKQQKYKWDGHPIPCLKDHDSMRLEHLFDNTLMVDKVQWV